jgi:hypothetical protein
MSEERTNKSKPYTIPTPLIMKSSSPITITDGKFTIVHSGNIIFHGDFVTFELEETQKTLVDRTMDTLEGRIEQKVLPILMSPLPEGYRLLFTTEAKAQRGMKRSRYQTWKRDKDQSYITIIHRNGNVKPIRLGSLLDPESLIFRAYKEFSKNQSFLRSDLGAEKMPMGLAHGQVMKASLDILEKEGYFEKTKVKVGKKREIDKYTRTDKRLE